ncbi:MAG: peroxiredoxin, partial [candidate division Zixibacteria bacterium]|nr:peroxiredoxin [candidate division Zixibacteria bacterium]
LALRGTFIIDPDGKLVSCEINDPSIGRSSDELLRKLQAAKFVREHGEVCPASWKPGEKTLKPGLDLVGKI